MDSKEHGAKRLREAVACGVDPAFVTKTSLRLFELLGSDTLQKPMYKSAINQLLEVLYRTPGYIATLGRCASPASATLICWFLISIALNIDEARHDEALQKCAATKHISACKDSTKLRTVLPPPNTTTAETTTALQSSAGLSIKDVAKLPGSRHDNDFMDYRSIKIVPTAEEAIAKEPAFTPLGGGANQFLSDNHAHALDYHFRLLREDFVRPLKTELTRKHRPQTFCNAWFREAVLKPLPCVKVKFDVPAKLAKASLSDKYAFWEDDRMLAKGALVCLVQNGIPLMFGRIAMRDTAELARESELGLSFESDDLQAALTKVNVRTHTFELVPVSSSFFAYEPILRCLQQLSSFPFAEELLDIETPAPISYLNEQQAAQHLNRLQRDMGITFDPSQNLALKAALRDRVSLIQGPPGTGKTFLGELIAQVILGATDATILCVCYTNHALDQFLEALMDRGIDDIVRLGGRSNNERIQAIELRSVAEKQELNAEQKKQMWLLKTEIGELEQEFLELHSFLGMDKLHWRRLSRYLDQTDPAALHQLTIPATKDGFHYAGKDGKAAGPDYLWKRWKKGEDSTPMPVSGHLWRMQLAER
eukprot:COSAG05_NODE_2703_length_2745_cov_4.886779_2_plen_592_part_01